MNATIRISAQEFNQDLFNHLRELFKNVKNSEITISFNGDDLRMQPETIEEYEQRLLRSVKQLEEGKKVEFTMESLAEYVRSFPKQ